MPVDVRSSVASRNRRMLNFFVVMACGCWLIWDESRQPAPSMVGYALGGLFVAWGLLIATFVLRPLLMRVSDSGVLVGSMFGTHDIAWDRLDWVDFDRPRGVLLGYRAAETAASRVAFVSRSMADAAQLVAARAAVVAHRPGLPTGAPEKVTA